VLVLVAGGGTLQLGKRTGRAAAPGDQRGGGEQLPLRGDTALVQAHQMPAGPIVYCCVVCCTVPYRTVPYRLVPITKCISLLKGTRVTRSISVSS
jgi:hypothetical protein